MPDFSKSLMAFRISRAVEYPQFKSPISRNSPLTFESFLAFSIPKRMSLSPIFLERLKFIGSKLELLFSPISPDNVMCKTVLFFIASGFGPNSPKLPIIPPIISEKNKRLIIVIIKIARKLGQKIRPKEILLSAMIEILNKDKRMRKLLLRFYTEGEYNLLNG